jgi:hypothetical protein
MRLWSRFDRAKCFGSWSSVVVESLAEDLAAGPLSGRHAPNCDGEIDERDVHEVHRFRYVALAAPRRG